MILFFWRETVLQDKYKFRIRRWNEDRYPCILVQTRFSQIKVRTDLVFLPETPNFFSNRAGQYLRWKIDTLKTRKKIKFPERKVSDRGDVARFAKVLNIGKKAKDRSGERTQRLFCQYQFSQEWTNEEVANRGKSLLLFYPCFRSHMPLKHAYGKENTLLYQFFVPSMVMNEKLNIVSNILACVLILPHGIEAQHVARWEKRE